MKTAINKLKSTAVNVIEYNIVDNSLDSKLFISLCHNLPQYWNDKGINTYRASHIELQVGMH